YFLDPQAGRRRRALARDRGTGAVRELEHSARTAGRDASNRMRGAMAEAKPHMEAAPVDDDTLHERIRAKLGHLLDPPPALEGEVDRGRAVLRGQARGDAAAARDASNRMRGAMAEATSHMEAAPVDDDTLHERIRAKLGHLLDRPSAVEVEVDGGHVVLSGQASEEEAAEVARYVAGMQGVFD